jgi:membrane protein DedA with SNARE-associated domain
MDAGAWGGLLPYYGIFTAAVVEGEVTYIAAAALVADGRLNPLAVLISGSLGAAIGDQAFFYAFRRRVSRWIAAVPSIERAAAPLLHHVRRHDVLMVFLIRFAPGLRIALAMACACADVPAAKFSLVNALSAIVWASALLAIVGWMGPAFLGRFGLTGWKGALLVGAAAFGALKAFGSYERRALERPDAGRAWDRPGDQTSKE